MNKPDNREDLDWSNEADGELHTSEWLGAIIRYFWNLGRREFNDFYRPKELKKNVLVGWIFKIILVLILIYLAYRFIT